MVGISGIKPAFSTGTYSRGIDAAAVAGFSSLVVVFLNSNLTIYFNMGSEVFEDLHAECINGSEFGRVICERPINISIGSVSLNRAPKKKMAYLHRVQSKCTGPLREEWSLEPWGVRGSWGYRFKYETGEMWLYQRGGSDPSESLSSSASLTSVDWSILRRVMENPHLWNQELGLTELIVADSACGDQENDSLADVSIKRHAPSSECSMVKTAVWESKSSMAGRWYFRASIRSRKQGFIEHFMLECFNSECGVFHPIINIPIDAWTIKIKEIGGVIESLFVQSRNWQDVVGVRRHLAF